MEPIRRPRGGRVFRVTWLPGSDRLQGRCHCGAVQVAEDPVEIWTWLLAHPVGHESAAEDAAPSPRPDPAAESALATNRAGS